MSRDDWIDLAACKGMPIDLFTPTQGQGGVSRNEKSRWMFARTICAGCAVAIPCLEWALETKQSELIYAGTLPNQRATIRRSNRKRELRERREQQ